MRRFSVPMAFFLFGIVAVCRPLTAQPSSDGTDALRTGPELFDAYVDYRETVGMLNPPLQMSEEDRSLVLADRSGDWMSRLWNWWLRQPGWFMAHGGRIASLDERLVARIWSEGDLRELMIWEHPGRGMVYATLVDMDTDASEIIARRKAPDWVMRENETAEKFREREIGNRRVVWKFSSPYLPPPPPQLLSQTFSVMSMSAPDPLELSWSPGPPDISVALDGVLTQGPFTLWHHTTGDLRGSQGLPGDWVPLHWQKDLPASPWLFTVDTSSVHPYFLRATAGVVDSDADTLDDGFELWHFQDLSETATGDEDNDGLENGEEFMRSTNPTVVDTDGDGLMDGDEVSRGVDPLLNDHPDVNLMIYTKSGG